MLSHSRSGDLEQRVLLKALFFSPTNDFAFGMVVYPGSFLRYVVEVGRDSSLSSHGELAWFGNPSLAPPAAPVVSAGMQVGILKAEATRDQARALPCE